MCIGVPLQVQAVEGDGDFALCADGDAEERLDMRLVGPQPVGAWVLSFQGAARRVLDAEEAAQIQAALQALHAAVHGDVASIDVLFADLINREPQLPAHLVPAATKLH